MTPRRAARPLSWRWFLIFALLFCAQVLPRLTEDSPAGDEPIDIVNGLYDWRGDVATVDLHPPLAQALQALPLWVLGLRPPAGAQAQEYVARDLSFLFETHSKNWPTFFFFPRLVTCLFGLGIGFLLYRMSREESPAFMICALGFWAFDPAILAFSGLAMADVPMAFFFLLSVWFFHRSLEQGRGRLAGWAGLFGAMAVTCKFSAFFLLPVLACLEWAQWREGRSAFRRMFQRWGWGLGAALVWVILVYLPGTVVIPGHPWPLHFLFSDFQLMPILMRHPDYFLGKLVSGGQLGYYPLAFVLKTPLSLLVFLALAFALAAARKIQIPT
ncbi:MAG TPA: glycosyltransferase family 39 protein, partial [bacterium]|nr:glycosyltransferase family 39 protein [bacterium]